MIYHASIPAKRSEPLNTALRTPVIDALTKEMRDCAAKLETASRWCAVGAKTWDTGISLRTPSTDLLAASVNAFVRETVAGPNDRVGTMAKTHVELSALPPQLASNIRDLTPKGLIPFIAVTEVVAKGWGHIPEVFRDVSLHVRPA